MDQRVSDNEPCPSGECPNCGMLVHTIDTKSYGGMAIITSGEERHENVAVPSMHWFGTERHSFKMDREDAIDFVELTGFAIRVISIWATWPSHAAIILFVDGTPIEVPRKAIETAIKHEITEEIKRQSMNARLVFGWSWRHVLRED